MEIYYYNSRNEPNYSNKLYIDNIIFHSYGLGCDEKCLSCVEDLAFYPDTCYECNPWMNTTLAYENMRGKDATNYTSCNCPEDYFYNGEICESSICDP
jgi:hypothetical protein